ncbi:putative Receptor protein kinase [Quillaja saponaria]|uniref:Receptor protein kinase n=1 Tax=Quillaja saponaria TaxID=32244 RepID=A0AAD7P7M7_QUISA|nr:putative Receptor protein kinase [Quillaja saponaria]
MNPIPGLALIIFFIFFLSTVFSVSASESELRSLLEFKKGIQSDPLGKVSWEQSSLTDPEACPRSWTGVFCDDVTGNITAIVLDRLGLGGELKFQTLVGMKMLRNLSLSGNDFTGRLPPALGSLTTLQHLDLSQNKFYGPIPSRINELWALNYLNLSMNGFKGGLPGGITNLQQLKVLDLHSNELWGGIGDVSSALRNVEYVDLSYNKFYGGLEDFSSLANSVHYVNLSHNRLNGGFFKGDSIALFRNLEVLDLGYNQISGELPSLGPLPNLRILRLGNNQLYGPIPEQLFESSMLVEELDLSGNGFTGSILVINSTTLTVLNVSANELSGSLPTSLRRCEIMDLSRNMFSGDISVMQNWEATLEILDLSSNKLSGSVPNLTSQFERLTTLNFKNNSLVGPLPSMLGTHPSLSAVDISFNELNGPLPGSFFTSKTLVRLNLSGNHFTGPIPFQGSRVSELLVMPTFWPMEYLDLSGNSLTGVLPSDIGKVGALKLLNLARNDFSGELPQELSKLTNLEYLDLSGNKFTAYHRALLKEFKGRSDFSGQSTGRNVKLGRYTQPSLFKFHTNVQPPQTSLSFSNDHLLTPNSRSLSGQAEFVTEIAECSLPQGMTVAGSTSINPNMPDNHLVSSGTKSSSGSPLSSSPRFVEAREQPVMLDVYSPDRLAGELFFLDSSLAFTAEELSRAPAEVIGRSSHGTLYKATLDSGYMLTVKWLRFGLVKHKKEFSREVKSIGSIRHPNIVPLRAYYWGPREQERLLLADYIHGDSLALHLYETTPRRYSPLSFSQRLKVAVDIAQSLLYLHDRGLTHGNLKPINILLAIPEYDARLTDYGLHRLMTPAGIAEQILNLGALGYRAPELATAAKPLPSFKADVYALGVILMELLTRRSAGDIISGQSGAVDLTDWVRLCDQQGRGMDCFDRDIAGGEEPSKAMDELLAISLRCILPVNERPNIRQVFDDLCSISL